MVDARWAFEIDEATRVRVPEVVCMVRRLLVAALVPVGRGGTEVDGREVAVGAADKRFSGALVVVDGRDVFVTILAGVESVRVLLAAAVGGRRSVVAAAGGPIELLAGALLVTVDVGLEVRFKVPIASAPKDRGIPVVVAREKVPVDGCEGLVDGRLEVAGRVDAAGIAGGFDAVRTLNV